RVAALKSARRRSRVGQWLSRVAGLTATGAALLAAWTGVRALFSAGRFTASEVVTAISYAAVAGAIGGFAYGTLGVPLRRRGRAGAYLAGIVAAMGYAIGLIVFVSPK